MGHQFDTKPQLATILDCAGFDQDIEHLTSLGRGCQQHLTVIEIPALNNFAIDPDQTLGIGPPHDAPKGRL